MCKRFLSKAFSNSSSIVYKRSIKYFNASRKKHRRKKRLFGKCITNLLLSKNEIETHRKFNIYRFDYEIFKTPINVDMNFGKRLKEAKDPNILVNEKITKTGALAIFTDGSKVKGGDSVGFACICPELTLEITKSLNKNSSIYSAESRAVLEAVKIAKNNGNRKTLIFSDSQSVLQRLKNNKMNVRDSSVILSIRKIITNCIKDNQEIELVWIPAHIGIRENEIVDSLAKSATTVRNPDILKITYTDLYETYKKESRSSTCKNIVELGQTKGRYYFENLFVESTKPWFSNKGYDRKFIVTVNRLRADHYNLAYSLAKIHVVNSTACECGHETEDIEHVVWYCPKYFNQRQKLIIKFVKHKIPLQKQIKEIIKVPDSIACRTIFQFLEDCQLKI